MKNKTNILFLTHADTKNGIGHLKRVLRLVKRSNFDSTCLILSEEPEKLKSFVFDASVKIFSKKNHREIKKELLNLNPKICISDLRKTPDWLCQLLKNLPSPIIAWDDYGNISEFAEVLICPLPHPKKHIANFSFAHYVPPETDQENYPNKPQSGSILISFGGSDPAALGEKSAEILSNAGFPVTLISGPLSNNQSKDPDRENISIIESPESLAPYLATHETVITTVGLTMAEALSLKRKVILIHPTPYHARLGKEAEGVIDLGEGKLLKPLDLIQAIQNTPPKVETKPFDFTNWWNDLLKKLTPAKCPICGSARRQILQRKEDFSLFLCKDCKSNYQVPLKEKKTNYESSYFEKQYRKTYGKSYEEDLQTIRSFAQRRLKKIQQWIDIPSPVLVDVGSAMGGFAYEALSFGFEAYGIEISDFASRYARKHFGLKILKDLSEIKKNIDVLTLWFTLEHFDDMSQWLSDAVKKLNKNAILCLGLPNGAGATAQLNLKHYLEIRPEEHKAEPSLFGMRRLLESLGLEVLDIKIFGLHPERFGMPTWGLVRSLQENLKLGDTFEIYARKKN